MKHIIDANCITDISLKDDVQFKILQSFNRLIKPFGYVLSIRLQLDVDIKNISGMSIGLYAIDLINVVSDCTWTSLNAMIFGENNVPTLFYELYLKCDYILDGYYKTKTLTIDDEYVKATTLRNTLAQLSDCSSIEELAIKMDLLGI